MIVVSNTSPIINLAAIGQVGLLAQLYRTILIPPAVYHEVVVRGQGQPGSAEVQTGAWVKVRPVASIAAIVQANPRLNPGEAEAIALALAEQADLLLIDERQGRQAATVLQLDVTGVLGILLTARQQGHIPAVTPLLDALRQQAGFWIHDALYRQVVRMSGE
jgi:uncharacterized protein